MLHAHTVYLNVSSIFMTEVERFDEEYVTVILKRIPDDSLFNYVSANATRHLDIWFNETKTSKLKITYNINYSVSVSAVLCDHVFASAVIDLLFGESDRTTIKADYTISDNYYTVRNNYCCLSFQLSVSFPYIL